MAVRTISAAEGEVIVAAAGEKAGDQAEDEDAKNEFADESTRKIAGIGGVALLLKAAENIVKRVVLVLAGIPVGTVIRVGKRPLPIRAAGIACVGTGALPVALVVGGAVKSGLRRVFDPIVSRVDLVHLSGCRLVSGVQVRMVLLGQSAIGRLQFLLAAARGYAKHLIGICYQAKSPSSLCNTFIVQEKYEQNIDRN